MALSRYDPIRSHTGKKEYDFCSGKNLNQYGALVWIASRIELQVSADWREFVGDVELTVKVGDCPREGRAIF
jgi:hypothetical protein